MNKKSSDWLDKNTARNLKKMERFAKAYGMTPERFSEVIDRYPVPEWEVGTQCAICGLRKICSRKRECYGLTPTEFNKRFHANAPAVIEPSEP